MWVDPAPSPRTLESLYGNSTEEYFTRSQSSELARADRVISLLDKASPEQGILLDIGCGRGSLMRAAKAAGWEVRGFEPVEVFARQAADVGPVHTGQLVEMTMSPGPDAIALLEVLEHVHDPIELLTDARTHAHAGTRLIATTPHAGRLDARLVELSMRAVGRPWAVRTNPLQEPYHLGEFSLSSMRVALERAGWRPLSVDARRAGYEEFGLPFPLDRVTGALGYASGWANRGHSVTALAVAT